MLYVSFQKKMRYNPAHRTPSIKTIGSLFNSSGVQSVVTLGLALIVQWAPTRSANYSVSLPDARGRWPAAIFLCVLVTWCRYRYARLTHVSVRLKVFVPGILDTATGDTVASHASIPSDSLSGTRCSTRWEDPVELEEPTNKPIPQFLSATPRLLTGISKIGIYDAELNYLGYALHFAQLNEWTTFLANQFVSWWFALTRIRTSIPRTLVHIGRAGYEIRQWRCIIFV